LHERKLRPRMQVPHPALRLRQPELPAEPPQFLSQAAV
jgi:hypothetical protein